MIARCRCGNEEEGNGFWTGEEKICRICGVSLSGGRMYSAHNDSYEDQDRVSAVLDDRGKILKEVLKYIREVKKLREIRRRGMEKVEECEHG